MKQIVSLFLISLLFVMGCASSENRVQNQNRSLVELRKHILAVMGGARWSSNDNREFYSQYFNPDSELDFDPLTTKSRTWARVSIIGDRRPYDVEIVVFVEEERSPGKFEVVDTNEKLEQQFKRELLERLSKSQEGVNIIDEFRAF